MQNIEKVLDRGEKLELLVDKTENLRYQADQFQKGGKALRNKMWWQNIKMKLLVGLILCVVIVIIVRGPAPPCACALHARTATDPSSLPPATVLLRMLLWRPQLRQQGQERGPPLSAFWDKAAAAQQGHTPFGTSQRIRARRRTWALFHIWSTL